MGVWEILLIIGCASVVVGVVVSRIVARKKGKPSCDCGCSDCAACKYCREAREKANKNQDERPQ